MDIKKNVTGFIKVFVITLVVTLVVSFLWNLLLHKGATVDWETAVRFAIVLGIILPIVNSNKRFRF